MRRDGQRRGFGGVDVKPARRFLEHFHRFEDVLLALFAEAGKVVQFAFSRDFLDVRHGGGLEIGPQEGDLLRAK